MSLRTTYIHISTNVSANIVKPTYIHQRRGVVINDVVARVPLSVDVTRLVDGFLCRLGRGAGEELLDHLLHSGRQEVALEGGYAARRLRGDEIDADDAAGRSRSLQGHLGRSFRSRAILQGANLPVTSFRARNPTVISMRVH